jgi:ribosome recycling factor
MSEDFSLKDLRKRMEKAFESAQQDFASLRTGRASANMLDPVQVEAYNTKMPINQVASISTPEARLINVQVWDPSITKQVEKAIRDAGLGLNPQPEGSVIRIPVPELNEERRQELVKAARKYAEQARISIRNIRRDGMDTLKKLQKSGEYAEDDAKRYSDDVQKATDEYISKIDKMLEDKEHDIMNF